MLFFFKEKTFFHLVFTRNLGRKKLKLFFLHRLTTCVAGGFKICSFNFYNIIHKNALAFSRCCGNFQHNKLRELSQLYNLNLFIFSVENFNFFLWKSKMLKENVC